MLISCFVVFYMNFTFQHVLPEFLENEIHKNKKNFEFVIDNKQKKSILSFHILIFLSFICLLRTMYTDTGKITEEWNYEMSENIYSDFLK